MFRRKANDKRLAISNLVAHNNELWNQLVAANREFERREAELKRERDEWRERYRFVTSPERK